jgi:hypothetical protein
VVLTKMQTLILWALLAKAGGASAVKNIRPDVKKSDREALVKAGLVASEKRGRDHWLKITDEGWTWANSHLDADVPTNCPAAGVILHGWLTQLKAFMEARGLAVADIFNPQQPSKSQVKSQVKPQPESQPESRPFAYPDIRQNIRKAYLQLTRGRFNTRAHLSDIRKKLRNIERDTLDEALIRMQREQEASLYQLDNRIEITDADRAAAIYIGREPRHLLWIER